MRIQKINPFLLSILIIIPMLSCNKKSADVLNVVVSQFGGSVKVNGKFLTSTGFPISYNDNIVTGNKSFCVIKINERNIMRLNQNTDFQFKISENENTIELKQGWLAGVIKSKFTNQGKFIINSPTVTAAVRGTSFCTKVENNNTYFCVCNGKIELMRTGQTAFESVESAHHSAMRFTKKADGSVAANKNVGLLYHDDAGLEKLAKSINVTIDWTKPDSK